MTQGPVQISTSFGAHRHPLEHARKLRINVYVRGIITPFGAKHPWPVIADERILGTLVSIGGGAHGVSITIDDTRLVSILAATTADITKQRA